MTVKELRDKILAAGGKIQVGGIVITYEEEKDIDVHSSDELIAYVSGSTEDNDLVEDRALIVNRKVYNNLPRVIDWLQFVGVKVEGVEPIVKIERILVENTEHLKLIGQVEVYEKMLLGRVVTLSA